MDNLITPEEAVAPARYCCLDDAIFVVSVADEYNVNFSKVFQNALMEQLHVRR